MPPSGSGGGRDFLPSTFPTVSVPAASWHCWQCCCRAGTLPSARPEPGTALAHTPSFPQHLICQAATAVPTFHGVFFFFVAMTRSLQQPGHTGQGWLCAFLPSLLSHSIPQTTRGCATGGAGGMSPLGPRCLSVPRPLCLCSVLAAPGLLPHNELRESACVFV